MARTLNDIFTSVKEKYVQERITAGLVADNPNNWSKVNIKRLLLYVIAFAIFILEQMQDTVRTETEADLANLRPPTVRWYAEKCLQYQHGFPLVSGTDLFDNTGKSETEIEVSKVIKYAAVQKQTDANGYVLFLRIKLCGESGNELIQLDNEVITGFKEYLKEFEAAGDNIQVMSRPADKLFMTWRVYYDPAILRADGSRLDGSAQQPVKDAILGYLKNMSFNGEYSITSHVDAVQMVQGVVTPNVLNCSASYDLFAPQQINEHYLPNGGYLRFYEESDLIINYIAK